jgi:hypothetical protein
MSETSRLIQSALLLLLILGYTAYLYSTRRKIMKEKREENSVSSSDFSETITAALEKKTQDKLEQRHVHAECIIEQDNGAMLYSITLASDIQLLETDNHLLIKGKVKSIAAICDEFAVMEQLPEGHCVLLGDWKLFVLDDIPQSSREDKVFVLPTNYWLFMSCKLKDSIYGEDMHPYIYAYEPFTFKKVLEYGIGVEATDYEEINNREL